MAEYRDLWSAVLPLNTPEERKWFEKVLALRPNEAWEEDYDMDKDAFIAEALENTGFELNSDDFESTFPNFKHELRDKEFWVYCEEDGNLDSVAKMVQTFFRKFRPDGFFSIMFASTCSKMRPNEFFGGAITVTADEISYHQVQQFVSQKLAEHEEKLKASKTA